MSAPDPDSAPDSGTDPDPDTTPPAPAGPSRASQWGDFLLGSPKRTLVTLAVLAGLAIILVPPLRNFLVVQLGYLVTQLVSLIVPIIALALVFRMMFKGRGGSSRH